MSRYIAFLRAINAGPGRTVKMDSVRQVFEALGFSEVSTFQATGNVVFETSKKNTKTLEKKIASKLQNFLGMKRPPLSGRINNWSRLQITSHFEE